MPLPGPLSDSPPRLPSRSQLVEKTKARLVRHGLPRIEMALILAATGGSGFLASYLLLQLGVDRMAVRYPLAVLAAYGAFFLMLLLWLGYQRRRQSLAEDFAGDAVDAGLEMAGAAGDAMLGGSGGGFGGGGGGSFGGGGASASFQSAPRLPVRAPKPSGKGFGFDLDFDLDEGGWLVLLVIAVLAVAALSAVFYVIWMAPVLLAEVAVDGLLMAGLYKRLKKGAEGEEAPSHWMLGAMRRTWIPAAVVVALFAMGGYLMQAGAPEARSIGGVWKAVTTGAPTAPRPLP